MEGFLNVVQREHCSCLNRFHSLRAARILNIQSGQFPSAAKTHVNETIENAPDN